MPDERSTVSRNHSQESDATATSERAPGSRRRIDHETELLIAKSKAVIGESRRLLKLPIRKG